MLCARLCRAACARLRRPHTLCALRGCAAPPARGCAARPCSVRGCAVPPARLRGTRGRSRPPLSPLPPTPTPWNRQRRCQGRCQCRHVAAVAVAERRMSSPRAVRGGPRPTQTRPLVRCALVKHATIGGRLTRPLARTSPCGTRRRSWLLVQLLLVACSYSLLAHRRRARRSRPLAARRRSSPPPLTAPSRAVATRHRTRPAHGCLLSWPLVARRRSPPLAAARRRSPPLPIADRRRSRSPLARYSQPLAARAVPERRPLVPRRHRRSPSRSASRRLPSQISVRAFPARAALAFFVRVGSTLSKYRLRLGSTLSRYSLRQTCDCVSM